MYVPVLKLHSKGSSGVQIDKADLALSSEEKKNLKQVNDQAELS